jgi:hypothetical protein
MAAALASGRARDEGHLVLKSSRHVSTFVVERIRAWRPVDRSEAARLSMTASARPAGLDRAQRGRRRT